jgi:P pilus assembly chaperone PapD
MLSKWIIGLVATATLLCVANAQASISLSGTRVIFDGAHKEANITVRNGGANVLIQSWIDAGEAANSQVPFAVTPALARLPANQQQLLRILYEGKGLPSDRESVLWLNVQEIPQAAGGENVLQLAVRQRVKVFFRPDGLPAEAALASATLQWQVLEVAGKPVLRVSNPSAFHVSMTELTLADKDHAERVKDSSMIAPLDKVDMPLNTFTARQAAKLSFQSINDYGGQNRYQAHLQPGQVATASAAEQR